MPGLLVITHLVFPDKARRQTAIEALEGLSQSVKDSEPETIRYAVLTSRDEADETNLWVLEQYTSQEAFDSHMASKPVVDMVASFSADPSSISAPPVTTLSDVVQDFSRPELANWDDPYVGVAMIEYVEGKRAVALEQWKHVASVTEKDEPDTLSYGIYQNREHPETMKTVEAYRNQAAFREVHMKSKAVQDNMKNYGKQIRVGFSHVWLKHIGGFLDRGNHK